MVRDGKDLALADGNRSPVVVPSLYTPQVVVAWGLISADAGSGGDHPGPEPQGGEGQGGDPSAPAGGRRRRWEVGAAAAAAIGTVGGS